MLCWAKQFHKFSNKEHFEIVVFRNIIFKFILVMLNKNLDQFFKVVSKLLLVNNISLGTILKLFRNLTLLY